MPHDSQTAVQEETVVKKKSLWLDVWRRLIRNKLSMLGLLVLTLLVIVAVLAPVLAPDGFDFQDYNAVRLTPCAEHWLGTDNFGRDILDRIIWGARVSMEIGFLTVLFSTVIGVLMGMLAAYYTKVDNVIMRFVDILMAIPSTLLAIAIAASLGSGIDKLIIALVIASLPKFARVGRAAVISVKEQEYIEAERAIGASDLRILFRHILPNAISPVIVQISLGMADAILSASIMSFIGLGLPLPTPEWGAMLSIGRNYLRESPHMCIFPGLAILLTVFALNVLGDGLRDALDPKLKN